MAALPCGLKIAANCRGTVTRHATTGACAPCSQLQQSKERTKFKPEEQSSLNVSGDRAELTTKTPEKVHTLADLIRVCEIDTAEWEVERWVANQWQVGAADADKKVRVTPLFQIKAWLKRKVAIVDARAEIEALKADAKTAARIGSSPYIARTGGAHMLQLDIPDLHIGKLAWAPETGHASYDSKIAERVFDDALSALIARTSAFKFKRVLLPLGNDLLNADNRAQTTTRGTPQDADGRYQKSFGVMRRTMTRAIERLREIAPVTCLMIPGNHDTLAVWHLGDSLQCYFHNTPDVVIDNAPTSRKYAQFGKVMLLFTHGDKGKRSDYPLLMATEQPEMFGATIHREAHTGHMHTLRVQEHHGVRVRISPALCPPDAWHAEMGFVGNVRAAQAFVWHEEEGLVSLATYTVPTEPKKQKRAA